LTTLAVLEPILTLENADELVARAAYASKLDAERLVAGAQPKLAPRDGVRAIARQEGATNQAMSAAGSGDFSFAIPAVANGPDESTVSQQQVDVARRGANATPTRPTLQAVSAEDFSLRVTIDAQLKADLDTLRDLLAHKVPNGDLRAVLREAVACAIEKHGKRRGAVEPKRQRAPAKAKATSANETAPVARAPSAEVRRQVWKRDGGRCAWTAPDGHRCGSTWKLEVDHVDAAALGGLPTVENCRLLCRSHNMAHAEATFGREHMERFRRKADHGRSAVSSREVAANDTTPLRTPASSGAA
jgi:hypothetical protein